MRRDDILVKIGDAEIADLQAMTDALRAHKPGDTVPVVVLRDGQPVTFTVTFGRRGG